MLQQVVWNSSSFQSINILSNSKSIWLSKEIRHELFMIANRLSLHRDWSLGFCITNKFSWNHTSLMHELIKTVLSVCTRLTKYNWSCINPFWISYSISCHSFTVAFHITLLNMGWESKESLTIWKNSSRGMTSNMSVVKANETHIYSDIFSD